MSARRILLCLSILFIGHMSTAQNALDYDSIIQKGKVQLQAGTPDLALTAAQQAITLDAGRWEGYALAGGALMNLKRYEEAADRLSNAIERAPQSKQDGLRELRRQSFAAESGSAPTAGGSAAQPAVEASVTQAEIVLWKSIENSNKLTDFKTYLFEYPNGAFVGLAKAHIEEIEKSSNGMERSGSTIPLKGSNPTQPTARLQVQACHIHGWTDCDDGPMSVDREGIEFRGSLHQFRWQREEIIGVQRKGSAVQITVKDEKKPYLFYACPVDPATNKCEPVGSIVTSEKISAALFGK